MEGYLWDQPSAKDAFLKAAKVAREAGRIVSLTLSDSFCVDRFRPEFQKLVKDEVDLLFANEAEILSLYEVDSFEDVLERVRKDCKFAALTRSELGAVIVANGDVRRKSRRSWTRQARAIFLPPASSMVSPADTSPTIAVDWALWRRRKSSATTVRAPWCH